MMLSIEEVRGRAKEVFMTLNPYEQAFVNEYLIDFNATRAYMNAGYNPKNYNIASIEAHKLKRRPRINEYLYLRMRERELRTEVTQDRVLREYAKLGFFDPRNLFNDDGTPKNISELDEDTAAVITSLEVIEVWEGQGADRKHVGNMRKVKFADKKSALDSIARHLGMFNDKVTHSGSLEVTNPYANLTTEELRKLANEEE